MERSSERNTRGWAILLTNVGTAAVLLLSWHYGSRSYDPRGVLFPSPWHTFATLWQELHVWLPHAAITYFAMISSVIIALALAIPVAFCMLVSQNVRHSMQTMFLVVQCLPLFVLAPILVMLFGWSQWNILIPATLMVLFPLSINLYKGISSVPEGYLELFKSHCASSWITFWKLRLPFAAGHLFAGLRLGVATAGMAVSAAEFSGAQEGLGVLLQEARRDFDLPLAFCGIVGLAAGIGALYLLVVAMERLLCPWRKHVATSS